jgi:two-component system OmpR family sensor kinase
MRGSLIPVPRTLRARLVAAATVSILAAVALFGAAAVTLVNRELRASLDRALRQRAQEVAQLAVSAPSVLTGPGALESPVSGRQIAVEVIDAHGRILARSEALGARLLPQEALARQALLAGRTGFEDIRSGGRPFRLYAAPIADAGGPAAGGAVLVASDTSDIPDTIGRLGFVLLLTGAGVALLATLAAAVLTRRGLRPLSRLADAAGEIERTADPTRRLPDTGATDEIGELTGVLNRMLAALEQARAGERRFLADASHELRTPVTTLLGNVEYAARHGADAEVLADLRRDAARLARLVDDLLVLERAAVPAHEQGVVDLASVVGDLVAAPATVVAGSGHDPGRERVSAAEIASVRVRGDEDELRRAVSNLIENALVHGPEGGEVTVSLRAAGAEARLTVSDRGTGPDRASRERLFERFWRGPEAAGRPGSGLGLSIAAAIAERHGGRIEVDGSAFTVVLPLA